MIASKYGRMARSVVPRQSRTFLTAMGYNLAKKQMPKMSETEKIALGAGTVGFDRDIFGGSPSLQHLLDTYTPKLSAEEQSFLDNEVEELCTLLDDGRLLGPRQARLALLRRERDGRRAQLAR